MEERSEEQELSRQYLLGEMDGGQRRQFEERLMTDPAAFEHVLMVEDELLEDYVFGALPADGREKVARHLLTTPEQLRKLEVIRAIKEYSDRPAAPQNRFRVFLREHRSAVGWAAALLLAFAVGLWALTRDSLEQELARLNGEPRVGQPADASVYPVELTSERFRGVAEAEQHDEDKVSVPREARVVELRVRLAADDAPSYRVVLERGVEQKIFTLDNLKAGPADAGKLLAVRLPARILAPGYYQLQVSRPGHSKEQFDDIGAYYFRVVK